MNRRSLGGKKDRSESEARHLVTLMFASKCNGSQALETEAKTNTHTHTVSLTTLLQNTH